MRFSRAACKKCGRIVYYPLFKGTLLFMISSNNLNIASRSVLSSPGAVRSELQYTRMEHGTSATANRMRCRTLPSTGHRPLPDAAIRRNPFHGAKNACPHRQVIRDSITTTVTLISRKTKSRLSIRRKRWKQSAPSNSAVRIPGNSCIPDNTR